MYFKELVAAVDNLRARNVHPTTPITCECVGHPDRDVYAIEIRHDGGIHVVFHTTEPERQEQPTAAFEERE